jgi:aminopeptidase N
MMSRVLTKCLFCLLSCFAFQSFAQSPSPIFDVREYQFQIELNDSTDIIKGTAEITVRLTIPTSELNFDLISKTGEKGMTVESVKLGNESLKFSHINDKLKITLSKSFNEDKDLTVKVVYAGIPKDGLIISKNKYGDRTFFADNWPNRGRNWLPIIDHPADKAMVSFTVLAPHHYEVVANGLRVEESYVSKKQKLTRYEEHVPISTKVMVIGVARFAVERSGVVNNIPIESWVYPQNKLEGFNDYKVAVRVLDFFNNHIGPYSYEKLANVQSKTTFGGLENASAIFYSEKSVTGKNTSETLIAHEIAHQWFGNAATEKDWNHLWLSEGFATYFALLYNEFTHGDAKRQKDMVEDRERLIAFYKKQPGPVVDPSVTEPMKLLNPYNYEKGSWFLHMLRLKVGDDNFWKGIRQYYREFQFSNALTSDFKRVIENVSGQNLSDFFDQWLFKAGHPVLDGSWEFDSAKKAVKLTIRQTQKGQKFTFPLEIGLFNEGSMHLETLDVTKESQEFLIPFESKPLKLTLDPNINLLFEGKLQN